MANGVIIPTKTETEWTHLCSFNTTGNKSLNKALTGMSEILVAFVYADTVRATVTCPIGALNVLVPDFMFANTRDYCAISKVNDTTLNVSLLSIDSTVSGSSTYFSVYGR